MDLNGKKYETNGLLDEMEFIIKYREGAIRTVSKPYQWNK